MKKSIFAIASFALIAGGVFFGVYQQADASKAEPNPKVQLIKEKDRITTVSLKEASEKVDFKIYTPSVLPDGLELSETVTHNPPSLVTTAKEKKKLTRVKLYYTNKDESKFLVLEQVNHKMVPGEDKKLKKQDVDGVEVSSYSCECSRDGGPEKNTYFFKKGSVTIFVDAIGVSEEEVLAAIKSLKH